MTTTPKDIYEINTLLQNQQFHTLEDIKSIIQPNISGFYWIYTSLPLDEFTASEEPNNGAHVNLNQLAHMQGGLAHTIKKEANKWWCIYNGKGKFLKNRIVAEFSNTNGATGTLALERCFDPTNFRIKYVTCDNTKEEYSYSELQANFERMWRLEYGWPFLCKH